jgi:hypothetical protein
VKSETIACARRCQLPVIPIDRVVDKYKILGKKWWAEKEGRYKG